MASKTENVQPNLKICIDNVDQASEMEDGEVEESSEDETPVKRRKQQQRERRVPPKIDDPMMDPIIRHNRRLPSPVQSDDEHTLTVDLDDLETFGVTKKPKLKVYENKPDSSFELGFDLTSEEAQKKRKDRAKRFGIEPGPDIIQVDDEKIKSLYESLGIKSLDSSERGIRLEAVHIRGVDNMSTEDVFKYFQHYGPQSIEWIDDSSCNVIWNSSVAAARAMLGTSEDPNGTDSSAENKNNAKVLKEANEQESKLTEKNEPEKMEEDDELNLLSSDEDEKPEKENAKSDQQKKAVEKTDGSEEQNMDTTAQNDTESQESGAKLRSNTNMIKRILPPGNWRIGKAGEKTKFLFMRFANKADHKLPGAERKSQYYKHYGNPNFGGMTGLISSSRKRRIRNDQYRQEVEEARRMVRKTEKYYHGIPDETSFDQHLREAQRARKLKESRKKKYSGDEDGESEEIEEEGHRADYKSRHYQNQANDEEDLEQWGRVSDPEEENKSDNQEEELDLELELGELMRKAPVYRMGRMYADDLEDQMKAKKEAAEELTRQMMRASDARRQIDHNRYKRTHDDRDMTLARTLHRSIARRQSDEDEPSDQDDTAVSDQIVVEDHTRRPRRHHDQQHHRRERRGNNDRQHRSVPHHRHHSTGNRDNPTISITTTSAMKSGMKSREQVRSAKDRLHTGINSSRHSSSRQQQRRVGDSFDKRGRRMHRHVNRRNVSESDSESSSQSDDGSSSSSSSSSSGSESEEEVNQRRNRAGERQDDDEDDELDLEDEDAILRLNNASKSNFKYEKLRIHVDPDDV